MQEKMTRNNCLCYWIDHALLRPDCMAKEVDVIFLKDKRGHHLFRG